MITSGLEELLQGVHAVLGGDHPVAFPFEQAAGDLAHGEGVIHHHHRRLGRGEAAARAGRRRRGRAAAGQRDRVEDQHDLAVAEHRGAGVADHPGVLRAGVLDDDFLVAAQASTCRARVSLPAAAAAPS
jgi:hypothetical protein